MAFGNNHWFPPRRRDPRDEYKLHTGVACPECAKTGDHGEIVIRYEEGYRLGCTRYHRMGGGMCCAYADPWGEVELTEAAVRHFERVRDSGTFAQMAALVRAHFPAFRGYTLLPVEPLDPEGN